MKSYLFVWDSNPDNWNEDNCWDEYRRKGEFVTSWRTSRKNMAIGDKAYLIKLGKVPRGIFASGYVASVPEKIDPYPRIHSVDLNFKYLLDYNNNVLLPQDELYKICEKLGIEKNWSPQNSGTEIESIVAVEIDKYLESIAEKVHCDNKDSELKEELLLEGKSKEVVLTRYERNPEAREACLRHFGYDCSVCAINFEKMYGSHGKNFIHVHHLKPISTIGKEYAVDYLNDLRPICPNCHSMIHREDPPMTIEELKELIKPQR